MPRRGQGAAVPENRRLALVGDTDSGRPVSGARQRLTAGRQGRLPDLLRLVFHPAGPGEMLRELLVATTHDPGVLGHQQGRHPGRAGVDRKDAHEGDRPTVETFMVGP
jgi:hypothetical protein